MEYVEHGRIRYNAADRTFCDAIMSAFLYLQAQARKLFTGTIAQQSGPHSKRSRLR